MSVPSEFLFWYKAKVVHVVDGDTLDLETDLGFRTGYLQRYRLYGVDTPEMNDPDPAVRERAAKAKEFVQASVGGKEVVIRTHLDRADKYGRWLAVVHFKDAAGAWVDLNAELLRLGLAREAPWR